MNSPLTKAELKTLRKLLTRAVSSEQVLVTDPTMAEFEIKFVHQSSENAPVQVHVTWSGRGKLPSVAEVAIERVRRGLDPRGWD